MTPLEALERIVYLLDRAREPGHKVKAFQRAAAVVAEVGDAELARRAAAGTLAELPGIGDTTARVIAEALAGEVPGYLARLESGSRIEISPAARSLLDALRGDLHTHSTWSDGGAAVETMARAAAALGHEYLVVTDHSARLTVARGLDRARLVAQLDEIAELNERLGDELGGFELLTGMEVDIFEDGSLDLDDDLLARLDLVVASVHSKFRMDPEDMTKRLVVAAANPHVDVLGHCTNRMIGKRKGSEFDADFVFAACARFGTAVEINSRPERLDPPEELLAIALEHGCRFAVDSDAHAPGQLEWQAYGCEMAAAAGVTESLIINTLPADRLRMWTASKDGAS